MKHFILGVGFGTLLFLFGCSSSNSASQERIQSQNPIEGKWKLVLRKFDPDTVFVEVSDTVVYEKVITKGTFVWYNYDKRTGEVIGVAGGPYELKGESYKEHIEFHYPVGAGIEGSALPFLCEIKDGKWYHSGFVNEREFDAEINDYVVIRERRLEEIWERLE